MCTCELHALAEETLKISCASCVRINILLSMLEKVLDVYCVPSTIQVHSPRLIHSTSTSRLRAVKIWQP